MHNYYVDSGRHVFHRAAGQIKCIMVLSQFGSSLAYLKQLHERMLREHVSLAGEEYVARRLARRHGTARRCQLGPRENKFHKLGMSGAWWWKLSICHNMRCPTLT